MATPGWYSIANVSPKKTEIFLYDEIGVGTATASAFLAQVQKIPPTAHIDLHISSRGGSVWDGLAIFDRLNAHPGGVTTHIDGVAASMASVIAMAGSRIKMAEDGFLMIHNPAAPVEGDADDMRAAADLLDKVGGGLANIYARRSRGESGKIQSLMDATTWFNAAEALAAGLVDEITPALRMTAKAGKFDTRRFPNLPTPLMTDPKAETEEPTPAPVETPEEPKAQEPAPEAAPEPKAETEPEAPADPAALASAVAELKARAEQVPDLTAKLTEIGAKLIAAEARAAAAEAKETANAKLFADLKNSLGIRAAEVAPPVTASNAPLTKDEAWATYRTLPIEARNKFYNEHRAILRG